MWVVLFVVFLPNVKTVVCTEHNLTFIWKRYSVFLSSYLLSDLFALYTTWLAFFDSLPEPPFSFSLTFFYKIILPNATPFARFAGWIKVFVLHSFSFAVTSCTVSHLLLLTKRLKAFLSLFVKLLFLPLRVKVSTVSDSFGTCLERSW